MSLPTPHIAHLTEDDYEHVYEPAEDSFILLDALEADADDLRRSKPTICVEIGSGSGIASTFLSSLLEPNDSLIISTDINRYACEATIKTASANDTTLNPILCNLLDPLLPRLKGEIDVLLFNPHMFQQRFTKDTQASRDIGGAWAGGEAGMVVTKMILDQLPHLLSPGGRFYLVAVAQNKPKFIAEELLRRGLRVEIPLKRRAGRELLYVLRIVAT